LETGGVVVIKSPQDSADARVGEGHGAKSSAVRDRAVLSLLTEGSISKAARKSGVNEKTLRRWLSDDEMFRAAYAKARQAAFEAGMNRIQALVERAVDTLDDLLDAQKHPAVRLGAARTVVELGLHQRDAEAIVQKLEEIESNQRQRRYWK
jgi:transposase-like protein